MPTILVPIDLTAAAECALAYANKLAVRAGAELVLVHCQPAADVLTPARAAELRERLHGLVERQRYRQLVRQEARRLRYRYELLSGCLHEHITRLVHSTGADCIVMSFDYLDCGEEAVSGNHAIRIAGLAQCPVLVVPEGRHALPGRAVLAADFSALRPGALAPLAGFGTALPWQLQLVQFHTQAERPLRLQFKKGLAAAQAQLPAVAGTQLLEDDDPLEGLSEYCAQQQAQLLVLAPADDQFLRRLFDRCYTRTQAYHTRIPVLVLPPAPAPTAPCCAHCAEREQTVAQTALSVGLA